MVTVGEETSKKNNSDCHQFDAGVVHVNASASSMMETERIRNLIGYKMAGIIETLGLAMASSPN